MYENNYLHQIQYSTYNDHLVADETEIQEEKFKICTDDSDCGVNKECKQFAGFDGSSCVCRQGYMYNSTSDACTALACKSFIVLPSKLYFQLMDRLTLTQHRLIFQVDSPIDRVE